MQTTDLWKRRRDPTCHFIRRPYRSRPQNLELWKRVKKRPEERSHSARLRFVFDSKVHLRKSFAAAEAASCLQSSMPPLQQLGMKKYRQIRGRSLMRVKVFNVGATWVPLISEKQWYRRRRCSTRIWRNSNSDVSTLLSRRMVGLRRTCSITCPTARQHMWEDVVYMFSAVQSHLHIHLFQRWVTKYQWRSNTFLGSRLLGLRSKRSRSWSWSNTIPRSFISTNHQHCSDEREKNEHTPLAAKIAKRNVNILELISKVRMRLLWAGVINCVRNCHCECEFLAHAQEIIFATVSEVWALDVWGQDPPHKCICVCLFLRVFILCFFQCM